MSEADNRMEELADRVEAASGPDRELDEAICDAIFTDRQRSSLLGIPDADQINMWRYPDMSIGSALRFTGSLDAAASLIPEGMTFYVDTGTTPGIFNCHACVWSVTDRRMTGGAKGALTPALALTAASLRARALTDPRP